MGSLTEIYFWTLFGSFSILVNKLPEFFKKTVLRIRQIKGIRKWPPLKEAI